MRGPPPPLRFLAVVIGVWVCGRAAVPVAGWWTEETPTAATAPVPAAAAAAPSPSAAAGARSASSARRISRAPKASLVNGVPYGGGTIRYSPLPAFLPAPPDVTRAPLGAPAVAMAGGATAAARPCFAPLARPPPVSAAASRWSGSAWILARGGDGPALAPGGTLGGIQAGARVLYGFAGGLALSARLYAPLGPTRGAEGAAGLDWRPSARLPFHLLAERRQAVGREGRSAFALTLYGGGGRDLPYGLRIDAYAQAGIVGARARDPFVDASVRLVRPVGPVEIGAGAWGAAQPGLSRADAGPSFSYRLPVGGANFRLQADWRFRLAGGAAPGSGPALILAADF